MQTQTPISSEMQTELNRINEPAGVVRWIPDPQEMLYVILARADHSFFLREPRPQVAELLTPSYEEAAKILLKFVGGSILSDLVKQRVCGAVEFFLRNTCQVSPEAMAEFKKDCPFDPLKCDIFYGLGLNGE
ncbi:MAG: hypothetical protein WBF09_05100 [Candidatus Acidiferrum sp.]